MQWRIRDGLLVARKDDGYLEIDVRRCELRARGLRRASTSRSRSRASTRALARPFKWFYVNTQSRIHVIVTHGFLKRLARLDLEESAVGRFAEDGTRPSHGPRTATSARRRGRSSAPLAARVAFVWGVLVYALGAARCRSRR